MRRKCINDLIQPQQQKEYENIENQYFRNFPKYISFDDINLRT
jgi:hypothetical protein